MSLSQLTQEELKEMSLIEIAFDLLKEKKHAVSFKELMDEITELRGLSEEEVRIRIAQFYTDLNIDGRFMSLGENRWGLRVWYPVDQSEEEHVTAVKPKKKKAKKVVDEDELEVEEYEELEEDDLDYDDVDDFDDEEDLLDDDLDEDVEEDDDEVLLEDEILDLDEDEVEEDLVEELEVDEEDDDLL